MSALVEYVSADFDASLELVEKPEPEAMPTCFGTVEGCECRLIYYRLIAGDL